MTDYEALFWQHHDTAMDVREAVSRAIEMMQDEGFDPAVDRRIEDAQQAMIDTQPSWGWRLARVWSALGVDFGDADSFDWSMQREFIRLFMHDEGARRAIQERDCSYPALGEVIR
jgi:hypothetical protein